MAPEWLTASLAAVSVRPILIATTGTPLRAALSSAAMKPAGSRTVSMNRARTRVEGCSSA